MFNLKGETHRINCIEIMNIIPMNKKSLQALVDDINKNFDKEVVTVSFESGKCNVAILGYGQRVCSTLLEAITFVQGIGVGILAKETMNKLK